MFSISPVPYEFLAKRVRMTWREVRYGVQKGFFSPKDVSAVANDCLLLGFDTPEIIELCCSSRDEPVLGTVSALAEQEANQDLETIQRTWAFVLCAWFFDKREQISDPLGLVEDIYADLDYPEGLSSFVRYMPTDGPTSESQEANEQKLYSLWEDYLAAENVFFGERK